MKNGTALDYLESVGRDAFELFEILVVPAAVGGSGDIPIASIVGEEHAVSFKGLEQRLPDNFHLQSISRK